MEEENHQTGGVEEGEVYVSFMGRPPRPEAREAYWHLDRGEEGDEMARNLYLKAFRLESADLWNYYRYDYFDGYMLTLVKRAREYSIVPKEEYKVLKSVADSEEEPSVFRAKAALTLGLMYSKFKNNENRGADFLREAVALCDSSISDDQKQKVFLIDTLASTVEEIIAMIRDEASKMLGMLCDSEVPEQSTGNPFIDRLHRLNVGGDKCDACKKTLEELGVPKLRSCGRCGRGYYCSKECQRKQWRLGHNITCRKSGQIKIGDIMHIRGLEEESRTEHNYEFVEIVGPDSTNSTTASPRWMVKVFDVRREEPMISVAPENLFHLRPEI